MELNQPILFGIGRDNVYKLNMSKLLGLVFMLAIFTACQKEEGQGGTSKITGVITTHHYTKDFNLKLEEYPAQEKDVYIIYGDNDIYGDRFKTDYKGRYEFKYLTKGNYRIYTLSKDTSNYNSEEQAPIFRDVQVTDKNQVIEVPEIIVYDN